MGSCFGAFFSRSAVRRSNVCFVIVALVLGLSPGSSAWSADDVILVSEEIAVTGSALVTPLFAAVVQNDPNGLYVLEQDRFRVRRLDLGTGVLTDFLDLPDLPAMGESGLKGLAFHPDYENNGRFYVHQDDGTNIDILEFTYDGVSSTVDPNTQRSILSFVHTGVNTNLTAGWIGFSPLDDYLYIPTGDGGSGGCAACGLPAQDLNDLRGKVLRIDVDTDDFPVDTVQNYGIPSDNPTFPGGSRAEVFAYGLRNPFRAGFDSLTGDLYIANVGSVHFEEINLVPANSGGGQNFGWRALEGVEDNPTFPDPAPPDAVDPIYFYAHEGGAAVIGGTVYRGTSIPDFAGNYIFADYIRGTVATFDPTSGQVDDFVDRTAEIGGDFGLVAFAEDADGEWYFMTRNPGKIFRISGFLRGDFDRNSLVNGADLMQWESDYGIDDGSDADADGDSDGFDFLIWQQQNGLTVGVVLAGDFDLNGEVNGFDFLLWQRTPSVGLLADWEANYGMGAPLSATSAAVPEPTTCTLALAALCLAMSTRWAF